MAYGRKRKRSLTELQPNTMMKDVEGITPEDLQNLALAGYKVRSRTTLAEFQKITASFDDIAQRMRRMEVDSGFSLNKMRTLWDYMPKTRETQEYMMEKKARMEDVPGSSKAVANQANFLLAPSELEGGANKEEEEDKETPETDVLKRHGDPTKAVPMGNIISQPKMSVVPDQTLNISPDDRLVHAPMEVLPGTPVPLIPAAALGAQQIQQVRMVAPQSLEKKQQMEANEKDPPSTKAVGGKDMQSDGFGNLVEEAKLGKYAPLQEGREGMGVVEMMRMGGMGGSRFSSRPIGQEESGDRKGEYEKGGMEGEVPEQEQNKMGMSGSLKHPWKQASLFRNNDTQMAYSKLLRRTREERERVAAARAIQDGIERTDFTWYKYNPATQGVTCPYVPDSSSNYLSRTAWTTDFQMLGAFPMINQFGPCSWMFEKMTGRFR